MVGSMVVALLSLARKQAKATETTIQHMEQLLDYVATNLDTTTTVCYYAPNMILNIHLNTSYLSEHNARSRAPGHFFLGWMLGRDKPIQLNGTTFNLCMILKLEVISAAEAEVGSLLLNVKQGRIMRLTLEEMRHS